MKQRTITAIILIAVLTPLVIIGGIPFYCLIALAIGWAIYELMKATEGKRDNSVPPSRCLNWPAILIIVTVFLFPKNLLIVVTIFPILILLNYDSVPDNSRIASTLLTISNVPESPATK